MLRTGVVGTRGTCPYVKTDATNVPPGSVLAGLAKRAVAPTIAASTFVLASAPAQAHNGYSESYGGFGSYTEEAGINSVIGAGLGALGTVAGGIAIKRTFAEVGGPYALTSGIIAAEGGLLALFLGLSGIEDLTLAFGIGSSALAATAWGLIIREERRLKQS